MAITTHGHHIPGSGDEENDASARMRRCGGVKHCHQCRLDMVAYRAANSSDMVDGDVDANRQVKVHPRPSGLERDLADLLNQHSKENESGTPDFILAGFLIGVLDSYNKTLGERAAWRGESLELVDYRPLEKPDSADYKEVPLVIYTNAQRNEIGTAKIHVTPGEVHVTQPITGALPIFGVDNISAAYSLDLGSVKDDTDPDPLTAFQHYQRKGLSS